MEANDCNTLSFGPLTNSAVVWRPEPPARPERPERPERPGRLARPASQ
ncbi:MAG: hypothetical protein ACE5GA_07785 [Candidatus Zixiibacteriota bacterium]